MFTAAPHRQRNAAQLPPLDPQDPATRFFEDDNSCFWELTEEEFSESELVRRIASGLTTAQAQELATRTRAELDSAGDPEH